MYKIDDFIASSSLVSGANVYKVISISGNNTISKRICVLNNKISLVNDNYKYIIPIGDTRFKVIDTQLKNTILKLMVFS